MVCRPDVTGGLFLGRGLGLGQTARHRNHGVAMTATLKPSTVGRSDPGHAFPSTTASVAVG